MEPPPFWRNSDSAFSPYKIKKRDHHSQNIFQKGFQTSRIFIKREIIQGPPFPSLPNISLRHSHTNNWCMAYIGPPPFWRKWDSAFSPYKIKKRDHHSQKFFRKGFQTSRIFHQKGDFNNDRSGIIHQISNPIIQLMRNEWDIGKRDLYSTIQIIVYGDAISLLAEMGLCFLSIQNKEKGPSFAKVFSRKVFGFLIFHQREILITTEAESYTTIK